MLKIKKLKINDNVKNVIPRDTVSNISDIIKVVMQVDCARSIFVLHSSTII